MLSGFREIKLLARAVSYKNALNSKFTHPIYFSDSYKPQNVQLQIKKKKITENIYN